MMTTILARRLLDFKTKELENNLRGIIKLVFDDGEELVTNYKQVIFSSNFWEFHRHYRKTPLHKKHFVTTHLKHGQYTTSTHTKNCEAAWFDVIKYHEDEYEDVSQLTTKLAKLYYEIINDIRNTYIITAGNHVISIDIFDFQEVFDDPVLYEHRMALVPGQSGIDSSHTLIDKLLMEPGRYDNNRLAAAYSGGLVRKPQVHQCLGPRGFVTDVNSRVIAVPIMAGYYEGITRIDWSAIESRSSAKALAHAKNPLQDVEYANRKFQILGQNLKRVLPVDCGSQNYLLWQVRGEHTENGKVVKKSDLPSIAGMYHLNEETNKLEIVRESDTQYIGKILKLRSPVAGCAIETPDTICKYCFGAIYLSLPLPEKTNAGQACSTHQNKIAAQLTLSTKHHDGSSVVEGAKLSEHDKKYLKVQPNGSSYYFADRIKEYEKVTIKFDSREAPGMPDIVHAVDVSSLVTDRVAELREIIVEITRGDVQEIAGVNVIDGKRLSSFTIAMLEHIRKVGWVVEEGGIYSIDMAGWDFSQPFLTLPMRHFSMADHQDMISQFMESNVKQVVFRDTVVSPNTELVKFHDMVNSRFDPPIRSCVLHIIFYTAMIVSARDNDYRLPKSNTSKALGVYRQTLRNRSLSSLLAYQDQRDVIESPITSVVDNRPDHPMDVFIEPDKVLGHLFGRNY